MPDERREIRIKRPASHNALDGSPFISRGGGERKGKVTELVPDSKDGCDIRHRPRGSLENEIGPKRECPRMVDENSREAAKECSPTAQAVGGRGERASPGGAKDNVAYVRKHPSPSDLQHSRTPPSDRNWISI